MRYILVLLAVVSLSAIAQPIELIEHRVWNKNPIHIVLPVGKERRIDFPLAINLQVPELIRISSEQIQITEDGSVYWIATRAFKRQRVNAVTNTGYSYILDIEAREDGKHQHPIAILDHRVPPEEKNNNSQLRNQYDYDYVDLIRFASQSLYAPSRLVKELPGLRQLSVNNEVIPLVRGGDLTITPLAQWVAPTRPTLYVTAVRVDSNASHTVLLDPRNLRGDFLAATSQHGYVREKGHVEDSSAWYLVSAQPFDEVAR